MSKPLLIFRRCTTKSALTVYAVVTLVISCYVSYAMHLDRESTEQMKALDIPFSKAHLGKKTIDRFGRMKRISDTTIQCGAEYSNFATCSNLVTLHSNCQPLCEPGYANCPGCDKLAADHANQISIAQAHCQKRSDATCALKVGKNGKYDYAAVYACCLAAAPPGPANCECTVQQTAESVCSSCGTCTPSTCGVLAPSHNGDYLGRKKCSGTWSLPSPSDTATCASPTILQSGAGYSYVSCYEDYMDNASRLLPTQLGAVTSALQCLQECQAQGFRFCGIEAGSQCFGSNAPATPKVPSTKCTTPCSDNKNICGGSYAELLYQTSAVGKNCPTGVDTCLADGTPLACGKVGNVQYYLNTANNKCVTVGNCPSKQGTGGAGTEAEPVCSAPTGNYRKVGCYEDYVDNQTRILATQLNSVTSVNACLSQCSAKGFKYCGLEYGSQCFGSNVYGEAGIPSNACTMKCADGELCGGNYAIEIYSTSTHVASPCGSPTYAEFEHGGCECLLPALESGSGYTRLGCYVDSDDKLIPKLVSEVETAGECLVKCKQAGWAFCGLKDKNECWGAKTVHGSLVESNKCTLACEDHTTTCGGRNSIELFSKSK